MILDPTIIRKFYIVMFSRDDAHGE